MHHLCKRRAQRGHLRQQSQWIQIWDWRYTGHSQVKCANKRSIRGSFRSGDCAMEHANDLALYWQSLHPNFHRGALWNSKPAKSCINHSSCTQALATILPEAEDASAYSNYNILTHSTQDHTRASSKMLHWRIFSCC